MNYIDPEPLDRAVTRMLCEIDQLSGYCDDVPLAPEKLERLARAVSLNLKAISDIDAHNHRVHQDDDDKKYLSYDDLPPPSPAERAHLIARFRDIYDRIALAETSDRLPEQSPGKLAK